MFRLRVLFTIAFIAASSGGAQFPVTPDGTAQGAYRVGDCVEWMLGDIWYVGTIDRAAGGTYQVNRDQFSRAIEWVAAAELRALVAPKRE